MQQSELCIVDTAKVLVWHYCWVSNAVRGHEIGKDSIFNQARHVGDPQTECYMKMTVTLAHITQYRCLNSCICRTVFVRAGGDSE